MDKEGLGTGNYLKEHWDFTKEVISAPAVGMAPRSFFTDGNNGTVPVRPFPPAFPVPVGIRGRAVCRNTILLNLNMKCS